MGVADGGSIVGLEHDYATFSKRGERGDHDLWGQHLVNLLARLGQSAATLVDWDYHQIDGGDIARISVEPSIHPVYDTKSAADAEPKFWWRNNVGTTAITDEQDRNEIIARRWG